MNVVELANYFLNLKEKCCGIWWMLWNMMKCFKNEGMNFAISLNKMLCKLMDKGCQSWKKCCAYCWMNGAK
jgi:hypothetical protein